MGWPGRASCTDVALAVVVLLIVASVTTPTAMPTRLTDAVSAPPSASPCADVAHDRTFVVTNGVNSSGESQAAFEKVYRERLWGTEGGGSGPGSEADATRNARIIIELVVHKYKVHRIVDAPCGAMAWMPLLLEKLHAAVPCFSYLGVDVARPVIAANAQRFVTVPWMAFRAVDFSTELLPGPPPDLIFCRDALQHLSMRLVLGALNTFAAALGGSRDRYLLVGSYERGRNQNIITGDYCVSRMWHSMGVSVCDVHVQHPFFVMRR